MYVMGKPRNEDTPLVAFVSLTWTQYKLMAKGTISSHAEIEKTTCLSLNSVLIAIAKAIRASPYKQIAMYSV
jgi:hypothetical protein